MAHDDAWVRIWELNAILKHDFAGGPFELTADTIKRAVQDFPTTGDREVRILCKQDTRESRPRVFQDNGLSILPIRNGVYNIVQGDGYVDILPLDDGVQTYISQLDFHLDTATVGDSEMQHLDYAYATSLVRSFMDDESLVLTIRGRKYTPAFEFFFGGHRIAVRSVQTEVDAGYEGRDQVVLVEAKRPRARNIIIRQLYYPYRQWQSYTTKRVVPLLFQANSRAGTYDLWEFEFADPMRYDSIRLCRAQRFRIEATDTK